MQKILFRFLVAVLLSAFPCISASSAMLNDIDLDGDGKADHIEFDGPPGGDAYLLTVNGVRFAGQGMQLKGTFRVVDIDSTDVLREIVVPEDGPSDDYAATFLVYRKGKIEKIGFIPDIKMRVDGSGIVRTMVRGRVLHTWFYPGAFRLDQHHQLQPVEQPLYPMRVPLANDFRHYSTGAQCTAALGFPLRASPADPGIIATIAPGEKFTIVASDNKRWCLVETGDGTWGWFELDGENRVLPLCLPASEVMDGLCMAD